MTEGGGRERVRREEVPGLGLEKQPPMVSDPQMGGGQAHRRLAVGGLGCPLGGWTPRGP